jgi:acyl-homoserine-lactone acylase
MDDGSDNPQIKSEIRYTEYGIAHIRASDYRSLGFIQGYAQARDNLCKIERGMLAFRGQLSRYFGPDSPGSSLLGTGSKSLDGDLYFRSLNESKVIERLLDEPAPIGPRAEVRTIVTGYVDGFNRFLSENHDVSCKGAEWLSPMQEIDVYRRVYAVTLLMGQAFFAKAIVDVEPPNQSARVKLESRGYDRAFAHFDPVASALNLPGSNAIALGKDATANGRGISVANPHLDWDGDMRWWQNQLTIPGKLDVSGASLIGIPLVIMGHTASVGWGITTAHRSFRIAAFELELVDGSPTTYWVDGAPEEMQRRDVSVEVKRPDGALEIVTKTQWWTRYGPVAGPGGILPLPAWNAGGDGQPGRAYAIRDANANNLRMLNSLFSFNHAKSTADMLKGIRETQGVPWWTVVAADSDGQALLSQIQVLPNITDDHAKRCNTELGKVYFEAARFAILDGSRSECEFQSDGDALLPGMFGPGPSESPRLPVVQTTGYVENSNDSHWLPNASTRITGMPRIIGDEGSERDIRTRGVISEIEKQLQKSPFTREKMQDLVLSNLSHAATLALASSVDLCRSVGDHGAAASNGKHVHVGMACELLARWNGRMDATSEGALLFSRYWTHVVSAATEMGISPWAVPFDPADPVGTPNTLAVDAPFVKRALADAVEELTEASIPLDAPLGDYQSITRGGKRFPLGGGTDALGVVNLLASPFGSNGFSEPFYGSGYLHVVAFDESSCPNAVTLLSYSQSNEANSPHHLDQTELFSQKKWVKERFCETDILASPVLEVITLD